MIYKYICIYRENEANKRKLQQTQVKLGQTATKEQETLAKFQETLIIIEQNRFDRADVDYLCKK